MQFASGVPNCSSVATKKSYVASLVMSNIQHGGKFWF